MSFDMRAKPFDLDDNAVRWVNDTFNAMTQEEKIAQLFVDMLWNDTGKQTAALLGRYPSHILFVDVVAQTYISP